MLNRILDEFERDGLSGKYHGESDSDSDSAAASSYGKINETENGSNNTDGNTDNDNDDNNNSIREGGTGVSILDAVIGVLNEAQGDNKTQTPGGGGGGGSNAAPRPGSEREAANAEIAKTAPKATFPKPQKEAPLPNQGGSSKPQQDANEKPKPEAGQEPEQEQEQEQEKGKEEVPEKQYLGRTADEEYYYLNIGESEGDWKITDSEGKVVLKPENSSDYENGIIDFLVQAQRELEMTEISADIFNRYILPVIEQKKQEEEEEEAGEEGEGEEEEKPAGEGEGEAPAEGEETPQEGPGGEPAEEKGASFIAVEGRFRPGDKVNIFDRFNRECVQESVCVYDTKAKKDNQGRLIEYVEVSGSKDSLNQRWYDTSSYRIRKVVSEGRYQEKIGTGSIVRHTESKKLYRVKRTWKKGGETYATVVPLNGPGAREDEVDIDVEALDLVQESRSADSPISSDGIGFGGNPAGKGVNSMNEIKMEFGGQEYDIKLLEDDSNRGVTIRVNDKKDFRFTPDFSSFFRDSSTMRITEDALRELGRCALSRLNDDELTELSAANEGKVIDGNEDEEEMVKKLMENENDSLDDTDADFEEGEEEEEEGDEEPSDSVFSREKGPRAEDVKGVRGEEKYLPPELENENELRYSASRRLLRKQLLNLGYKTRNPMPFD